VSEPDPLVEEILRARRERLPVVIGAALGIVLGVALAMATFLGALAGASGSHAHDHAALAWFGSLIACPAIGVLIYQRRTRRRR
jgi:hypothetical protein